MKISGFVCLSCLCSLTFFGVVQYQYVMCVSSNGESEHSCKTVNGKPSTCCGDGFIFGKTDGLNYSRDRKEGRAMSNEAPKDMLLEGEGVAWARLVLLKVGFDVSLEAANKWLRLDNPISKQDLERARETLGSEDIGKSYLSVGNISGGVVAQVLRTTEGRKLVHQTLKTIGGNAWLEVLGLADNRATGRRG